MKRKDYGRLVDFVLMQVVPGLSIAQVVGDRDRAADGQRILVELLEPRGWTFRETVDAEEMIYRLEVLDRRKTIVHQVEGHPFDEDETTF